MIGKRLKSARLALGITQETLVARLRETGESITKQGISNYENGKRTPAPSTLIRLARVLHVRPASLLHEQAATVQWVSFRCQSKLGERKKQEIRAFAESHAEKQTYLSQLLPDETLPEFPQPVLINDPCDAEKAASDLRTSWDLGENPISSVTQTIENKGGHVVAYGHEGVVFDGLSGWINDRYPLVVVNSLITIDRLRFNLAHELGHLVMNHSSHLEDRQIENLAHRFAGAFLAPADVVKREFGKNRRSVSVSELKIFKMKYGLSMQATLFRLKDLDIIKPNTYSGIMRQFSNNDWRKNEPGKYQGDESPTRLSQMASHAYAEGLISAEKVKWICPECEIVPDDAESEAPVSGLLPSDILAMPLEKRRELLANAAQKIQHEYREDGGELRGFDAFEENDLHE